jgi:hypothetical protein
MGWWSALFAGTIIFTAGMITLVTADPARPERRVSGRATR